MQMGLKINGGGGVDTSAFSDLAKAFFGDPNQARQDALARSQLMNDEYNRAQFEAATRYQEQLKASAAEKAAHDAAIFNADTAAGPVRGRMIHDAQYLGDEAPAPVELSASQPDLSTLLAPVDDLSSLNTGTSPNTPPTPSLQPEAPGSLRLGGYNSLQRPAAAADALPFTTLDAQPVPIEDVLQPGKVVDNGDGSLTVGTREGNVRLSREEADILGLSDAYKQDAAGQTTKDAGTASFIYDDNLNISPEVRAATLAAGGSVVGKDAAAAQDGTGPAFNEAEQKLRKEYTDIKEVDRFNVVDQRFTSLQKHALNPNHAIGDTFMIYDAVKIADPTSSVMGGEQVTMEKAPGLTASAIATFNGLIDAAKAGKWSTDDRQAVIDSARGTWETHAAPMRKINEYYRKLAIANGLEPDNIIVFPVEAGTAEPPPDPDDERQTLTLAQARGDEPIILPDGTEDPHLMSQAQWNAWKAAHPR